MSWIKILSVESSFFLFPVTEKNSILLKYGKIASNELFLTSISSSLYELCMSDEVIESKSEKEREREKENEKIMIVIVIYQCKADLVCNYLIRKDDSVRIYTPLCSMLFKRLLFRYSAVFFPFEKCKFSILYYREILANF